MLEIANYFSRGEVKQVISLSAIISTDYHHCVDLPDFRCLESPVSTSSAQLWTAVSWSVAPWSHVEPVAKLGEQDCPNSVGSMTELQHIKTCQNEEISCTHVCRIFGACQIEMVKWRWYMCLVLSWISWGGIHIMEKLILFFAKHL